MGAGTAIALVGILVAAVSALFAYPAVRSDRRARRNGQFAEERLDLVGHRPDHVISACALYSPELYIPGTRFLSPQDWRLDRPIPIAHASVRFRPQPVEKTERGTNEKAVRLLPVRSDGKREERYSAAIGASNDLRPGLWWDAASYDLSSFCPVEGGVEVDCGLAQYFEMIDVCESLSHEFVAAMRRGKAKKLAHLPYRESLGDPFDMTQRVFVPAIPTLPLLRSADGSVSFLMHERASEQVASAGGCHHVFGGQFQPSTKSTTNPEDDADLWLSVAREFAEELLGFDEAAGGQTGAPLSPFEQPLKGLNQLRDSGAFNVWILGLGLDPLSLWPDLLTVAVIDSERLSEVFPALSRHNSEGTVLGRILKGGRIQGFNFDQVTINRFVSDERTAPAATACLQLSWKHRDLLLV